tara:strand:- start:448 stop:711 length:264 start_codon:yes stop_codon:yes gene_type:complete
MKINNMIIRKYMRIPFKKHSLGFHQIPYHLQYESRDFNISYEDKPTARKEIEREKYIKEFNPYLKSNVSENLDQKLAKFYREKYNQR